MMLPELKGGETIRSKAGRQYVVRRVRRPKRETGYIEPLYRLDYLVTGSHEWTLQELNAAGVELVE